MLYEVITKQQVRLKDRKAARSNLKGLVDCSDYNYLSARFYSLEYTVVETGGIACAFENDVRPDRCSENLLNISAEDFSFFRVYNKISAVLLKHGFFFI